MKFNVGGYLLDRPFQIRRLGHFQYFSRNLAHSLDFYTRLLGFQVTDSIDFGPRIKLPPEELAALGDTKLYFTRFGSDHHAFILGSARALELAHGRELPPQISVGQITWQVGSLKEVVDGHDWFAQAGIPIVRAGRDAPGSNWHAYLADPDGEVNEIYYGIEQIGWDGLSKPKALHAREYRSPPPLPHAAEYQEIEQGIAAKVDLSSGNRCVETAPFDHVVAGIRMPRPFKITGIGPVRLFARDLQRAADFYQRTLGLALTEEITWRGHRCLFLRAGSEHHSMALYPEAVRGELGLGDRSLCFSFGVRLHDYQQLLDCMEFLGKHSVEIRRLPSELFPGMEYTAFAVDPDGHLVQLYCYMEQVDHDGQPRPAHKRRRIDTEKWPDALEPLPDSFAGQQFLGPWI